LLFGVATAPGVKATWEVENRESLRARLLETIARSAPLAVCVFGKRNCGKGLRLQVRLLAARLVRARGALGSEYQVRFQETANERADCIDFVEYTGWGFSFGTTDRAAAESQCAQHFQT
jgi:hypothetical protein